MDVADVREHVVGELDGDVRGHRVIYSVKYLVHTKSLQGSVTLSLVGIPKIPFKKVVFT
jgi:hypothetical protein